MPNDYNLGMGATMTILNCFIYQNLLSLFDDKPDASLYTFQTSAIIPLGALYTCLYDKVR